MTFSFNACNYTLEPMNANQLQPQNTSKPTGLAIQFESYNQATRSATYLVKNTSDREVKNMQVHYQNISKNPEKKKVLMNNHAEEKITLSSLPAHRNIPIQANLSFPTGITQAKFKLELQYAENSKTIASVTKKFTAPPPPPPSLHNQATLNNPKSDQSIPTPPWKRAIEQNDLPALKSLFKTGADVNKQDQQGNTILHHLTQMAPSDTELIKYLLGLPGINTNLQNEGGNTALHLVTCMENFNETLFEGLLSYGAKSNIANKMGDMALHHAAAVLGDPHKVRKMLMHSSADEDAINLQGNTALCEAIIKGKIPVIEFLLTTNADVGKSLHLIIEKQEINSSIKDNIELLLKYRIPPNILDDYTHQNSLLHKAVQKGHKDIVDLLLRYQADVHAKNSQGKSPIDLLESEEYQGKEEDKQEIRNLLCNNPLLNNGANPQNP
eukprot:gene160-213_t